MPTTDTLAVRQRRPRRWLEWAVLSAIVVALVLVLDTTGTLRRPNRLMQDSLIALRGHAAGASDVVIVGIDDKSIDALGRWPWRRSFHAALIDRIDKDAPRAIGLDLLTVEADEQHPGDDAALASALQRSGKVVQPVMMQNLGGQPVVVRPIPALASNARGLGHVHLALDDDGVARSVYLREGLPGRMWSYFSLAVLDAGRARSAAGELQQLPGSAEVETHLRDPVTGQMLAWQRTNKMVLPFAGPPGHFKRVSYIDVLDGEVPPGTFKDKYVLVGATASGLGDQYATPVSGSKQLMSGIEFSANVLDGLLGKQFIAVAPAWLNAAFNTLAVLLVLAGLALLGPLSALLLSTAVIVALPAAAAAATALFGLQFGPAAGMLGAGLAYALWSWRRLDVAARYLVAEFRQLRASGGMVAIPASQAATRGDFLDRRIDALGQAAQQLRDLHRFVSDTLESQPDAILVCDRQGNVLLANAAAARHFSAGSGTGLHGACASALMRDVRSRADQQPVAGAAAFAAPAEATSVEARDDDGRDLLIKQTPSFNGRGEHVGWILSLIDVTEMREAQRQRDHAMRFLGHDIRAPQASILTLLALHRQDPATMTQAQFNERIERHARKTLALSDDFIHLLKAQSQGLRLEPHNLADLLLECVDDAWEASLARRIRIAMSPASQQPADAVVDRELVSRAIGNLLGNALKFSPEGGVILCAIESCEAGWAVSVHDHGPGIAKEIQAQLFQPFARGHSTLRVDGAGLGLAFVKTVAHRHGGEVRLDSEPGHGSTFWLIVPKA